MTLGDREGYQIVEAVGCSKDGVGMCVLHRQGDRDSNASPMLKEERVLYH